MSISKDRVVRPFEWGLDWIPGTGRPAGAPPEAIGDWVAEVMADTDAFFTPAPTDRYRLGAPADGERRLTFPSAFDTPHPENNTVHCRYFPTARPDAWAAARGGARAAAVERRSRADTSASAACSRGAA